MAVYDLANTASNCPPSVGNVDIFTRIVDYRSKTGEAGADFAATVQAMQSGGNGTLSGICVEAHSNVPNSTDSTVQEAKDFAKKICRANLTGGLPIYVYGHGNTIPSADYWVANRNKKYGELYNHRIIVRYIYSCPAGVSCIAPLSGIKLSKIDRVAFGAGVCVDTVAAGITLRSEAENTAKQTENTAREMMSTVREMLAQGITSATQQQEVTRLQQQASIALKLAQDMRDNLNQIPAISIEANCSTGEEEEENE